MKYGCVLDVQHGGRASRPGDGGAAFDLNGNGVIEDAEREVQLAGQYALSAADVLRAAGVDVCQIEQGEYYQRHRAANVWVEAMEFGRAAYVACHVNAGGGAYGLVIHDYRSKAGKLLAACIAQDMGPFIPPLTRVAIGNTAPTGVACGFPRAWTCIHGVGDRGSPRAICGIVFEPGFIDNPALIDLWKPTGLTDIGRCLAHGILRYLTQDVKTSGA